MKATLDIPGLIEQVEALTHCAATHHSVVVVAPLREDMREVACEFLTEGPPFDPKELGLSRHQVFVTDREVVFVFESEHERAALAQVLAEPDVWSVVSAWGHLLADQPRIATTVYEWPEHPRPHPPETDRS